MAKVCFGKDEYAIGKENIYKQEGPDQPRSWLIAVAGFVINGLLSGVNRTSGLFYVGLIEKYGVSRMEANLPFTLRNVLRYLGSPIAGAIGHRYGVRNVTFVGGVCGALGFSLCCFASNVTLISVFWGGIYGTGVALGNTLHPVIVNQYFSKYRATASGFSASSASISAFIFPLLVEYLLDHYGLAGTFLIVGGIMLHTLPAALLMKEPSWMKKQKITKEKFVTIGSDFNIVASPSNNCQSESENAARPFLKKENIPSSIIKEESDKFLNDNEKGSKIHASEDHFVKANAGSTFSEKTSQFPIERANGEAQETSLVKSIVRLLCDPMFYVISISQAGYSVLVDLSITVIVDYMKDKGLLEENAKYFIMVLSMGDLSGKLGFGWVTDKKFITIPKYMLLLLSIQGILFLLLPLFYALWTLIILILVYGLAAGATYTMFPILVAKYLGSVQTLAIGSIGIFSCIFSFAIPPLIGYFRDRAGSYDGLFLIMGSLSTLAGCLWFFEPLYVKLQRKNINS